MWGEGSQLTLTVLETGDCRRFLTGLEASDTLEHVQRSGLELCSIILHLSRDAPHSTIQCGW